MSKISWWSKFCALPRFSFLLAEGPSVRKVHDTCGNWVDQSAASQIVDDMQAEINALRERLERLKLEGARPFIPQDVEEFIEPGGCNCPAPKGVESEHNDRCGCRWGHGEEV